MHIGQSHSMHTGQIRSMLMGQFHSKLLAQFSTEPALYHMDEPWNVLLALGHLDAITSSSREDISILFTLFDAAIKQDDSRYGQSHFQLQSGSSKGVRDSTASCRVCSSNINGKHETPDLTLPSSSRFPDVLGSCAVPVYSSAVRSSNHLTTRTPGSECQRLTVHGFHRPLNSTAYHTVLVF